MEKDNWIRNVLDSIDKTEYAEPSPFLFTRIEQKIELTTKTSISKNWVIGVTVTYLLLILLNLVSIKKFSHLSWSQNKLERYSESIGLNTSNQIYSDSE